MCTEDGLDQRPRAREGQRCHLATGLLLLPWSAHLQNRYVTAAQRGCCSDARVHVQSSGVASHVSEGPCGATWAWCFTALSLRLPRCGLGRECGWHRAAPHRGLARVVLSLAAGHAWWGHGSGHPLGHQACSELCRVSCAVSQEMSWVSEERLWGHRMQRAHAHRSGSCVPAGERGPVIWALLSGAPPGQSPAFRSVLRARWIREGDQTGNRNPGRGSARAGEVTHVPLRGMSSVARPSPWRTPLCGVFLSGVSLSAPSFPPPLRARGEGRAHVQWGLTPELSCLPTEAVEGWAGHLPAPCWQGVLMSVQISGDTKGCTPIPSEFARPHQPVGSHQE